MFRNQDPRKRKSASQTWTVEKLKGGGAFFGWLAGPTIWVWCHLPPPSKPCYTVLTEGVRKCPHCRPHGREEFVGYVPLYDAAGRRLIVLIKEYTKPVVDAIRTHTPVKVSRGKGHHDPIMIESSKWASPTGAGGFDRFAPADIRDALLTIWGDTELADYFRCQKVTEADKLADVREESGSSAETPPKMAVSFERNKAFVESVKASQGDKLPPTVGEVILPLPKPSRNGYHRPLEENPD